MTTSQTPPSRAVIYCRVSSKMQVEEGHGLESQETRCREYATRKGFEVVKTFYEKAVSGGTFDRPSFNTMLDYVRKSKIEGVVVIIDDISRFARDIEGHWALRRALKETGGTLESPSITFGEDSDSILIENLLASVSQHQRQKNGEQTKNRMRARVMNGYWVFHAPPGFSYEKTKEHGKLLMRTEPLASIIQEALEGFASGRFETQGEVKRFLENQPDFPKDRRTGLVRFEEVVRLMRRVHYAGYIEAPDWGVSLRKGHHTGLISLETFQAVQRRMKEGARVPARKDISADFPLRGFVLCNDCQKPLTACWSTSKTKKKHPYYLCPTKGCVSYRKSIRRDVLEGDFAEVVRALQPSDGLFSLVKAMFKDVWTQRMAQAENMLQGLKREAAQVDKQIENLLDRIVETENPRIIAAYEKRLSKLETDKLVLAEKQQNGVKPAHSFDDLFELATNFLANPWKLWESGQLTLKRTVLRLAFSERIAYCRNKGLRTPKTTLPFKVLEGFHMGKCEMAGGEGFEPPERLRARWFSRPEHSTTLPPTRKKNQKPSQFNANSTC